MLDIALLRVFSEYLLMFQFVACRTLDTYAHVTTSAQRQAAEAMEHVLSGSL